MAIGHRLLKLAAKIVLDKLIGQSRTDEAAALLHDWWSADDEVSRDQDLADAKEAASDSRQLAQIVAEAVAAQGERIAPSQVEALTLSLSSGFKALPDHLGNDPAGVKTIAEQLLPGRSKTFVVWLDHPAFSGPRRYVHFNWDGESWRVRDFVGGTVFHPPGSKATDKGLAAAEVPVSALEVWKASRGQIQSLKQYGLNFPISNREGWQQVLALLSRVAEEW